MKSQQIEMLQSRIRNPIITDEKTGQNSKQTRVNGHCFMNVNLTYNSVNQMCIKLKILLYNLKTDQKKKAFLQ